MKIYRVTNSIFSSNTFILYAEDSPNVWLIDCGDVSSIGEWCEQNGKVVQGVFITHTHFDHLYGIMDLIKAFPDVVIYTSKYGAEAIFDDRLNLSQYHKNPICYNGDNPVIIKEGDSIDLFENYTLEIFETPGHNPSCLTYIVDNYIFTGDSYIPNIKVVTNLPKGNKVQAEESLQRILKLSEGKIVCPGHTV